MKNFFKKYGVTILLLAIIVAVVVAAIVRNTNADPHAGHDHGDASAPSAAIDPTTYMAKDSYKVEKAADGTYSVTVLDYTGGIMLKREGLKAEPTVTVLNDALLCVSGTNGAGISRRWGILCAVRGGRICERSSNFITAKDNNIVYLDNLTNAWHVFIQDAFNEAVELTATTLTGAVPNEDGEVIASFQRTDDGDLTVTYFVEDGATKTVTVDLP